MFEKVSPSHCDKIADRIAGALVDMAYALEENPKIAVEVLIGPGKCLIIAESSVKLNRREVRKAVYRIAGKMKVDYKEVPQDEHLAKNQEESVHCGDNGIFKGMPVTEEQKKLTALAKEIYSLYPNDGKYILDKGKLTICHSRVRSKILQKMYPGAIVNPLGYWTGGTDVDTGVTNRKLGSDMGDSVTGGGLCLSGDSEFLSDDFKWYKISEYRAGQKVGQYRNGRLEFVVPNRYIQNESDNFILFENNSKLSMCLTPYHEIVLETSKGNLVKHPALLVADNLLSHRGSSGFVLHSFRFDNSISTSKYIDENDYRLQVAFCADGTLLLQNSTWKGRIRVKKQYKKDRLRELLKDREHKETQDNEYSIFWFNPTVLSKSLYECFSAESFDILRDEVFRWDGDYERKIFRTTHKEDADFIQFVLTSGGYAAGIDIEDRLGELFCGVYERKSILYTVTRYASTTTGMRDSKDSEIRVHCLDEKAPSYCFTVPSHMLVIRHNNRIFITGNCGKDLSKADVSVNIYAFLKAQETGQPVELSCSIGDAEVDGKPYAEIVSLAKKYIEKLGGFEAFAEWGLIR